MPPENWSVRSLGAIVEPDDLEHLADAPLQLRAAHPVQLAEEAQVLASRSGPG